MAIIQSTYETAPIVNELKPGAWITPAMLDKIENDDPLSLLSHADTWYNWPQRWKALRKLVDESVQLEPREEWRDLASVRQQKPVNDLKIVDAETLDALIDELHPQREDKSHDQD